MFDMRYLTRLKKLDENAPDVMRAFWAFHAELSMGSARTGTGDERRPLVHKRTPMTPSLSSTDYSLQSQSRRETATERR